MNRNFSLLLLAIGVIVLCMAYRAATARHSLIYHFWTGHPAREVNWMVATGAISAIAGLAGLFRGQK
jgi:hypothetical protein